MTTATWVMPKANWTMRDRLDFTEYVFDLIPDVAASMEHGSLFIKINDEVTLDDALAMAELIKDKTGAVHKIGHFGNEVYVDFI